MSDIVYLNGNLIPLRHALISPLDYGFFYGFGLFETMRSYDGYVFLLNEHLQRLSHSANTLGMIVDHTNFEAAIVETTKANNLTNARIRLTVSAGKGMTIPDISTCKAPTVLVTAGQYEPYPDHIYQRGFRTIISSIRRNSLSALSRMKSTSYIENILARKEAKDCNTDEAICLNEKGHLAEASSSNIFLVINGVLLTPNLDSGILPGITRKTVLELAKQLGIKTVEASVPLEQIFDAQELFITNSLIEIMPLREINDKPVGSDPCRPVTSALIAAYKSLVSTKNQTSKR